MQVRRASDELRDMAAALEETLRAALSSNGSTRSGGDRRSTREPPGKGSPKKRMSLNPLARAPSAPLMSPPPPSKKVNGPNGEALLWDHSQISTAEIDEAVAAIGAFPLLGAQAAALIKQAELVSKVRTHLLACAWSDLHALLGSISDLSLAQLDEVRAAGQELEEMREATEGELATALTMGRSLKVIGKKTTMADKSYYVAVEWDHSGLETGKRRLQRAVSVVEAFPKATDGATKLLANAQLVLSLRTLILEEKYSALGGALEAIRESSQRRLDEVGMAWQEYLCWELERVAKPPSDQAALKSALARATAVGMLPVEKPVHKAMAVFIDPVSK